MAFSKRCKADFESNFQLPVELLRDEEKLVAMMAKKAETGKDESALEAFQEEVDELVNNLAELAETRGDIKRRLNEIEAERAFLQRRAADVEQQTVKSIELLRNKEELDGMMKQKDGTDKEETAFHAFKEKAEELMGRRRRKLFRAMSGRMAFSVEKLNADTMPQIRMNMADAIYTHYSNACYWTKYNLRKSGNHLDTVAEHIWPSRCARSIKNAASPDLYNGVFGCPTCHSYQAPTSEVSSSKRSTAAVDRKTQSIRETQVEGDDGKAINKFKILVELEDAGACDAKGVDDVCFENTSKE
ncbi:hypothetical protein IWZ01DRAFT_478465 [Phyllosticta capitalensis]